MLLIQKTILRMKQQINSIVFLCLVALFTVSCGGSNSYVPKPRGLNHIELPEHIYQQLEVDSLTYNFEYSKHARVLQNNSVSSGQIIDYDSLDSKVWLTYFPINGVRDSLESYIYTSYKLLQKHNVKAYAILNDTIKTKDGKTATVFYLEGEVPSMYQFYVHDSTKNFIRGAMYFETATKNDSLQPIYDFVKEDVNHLLETLEWKND